MIRITGKGIPALNDLKKAIPNRIRDLKRLVARQTAEDAAKAVRERITGPEPWLPVYRDSIAARQTGDDSWSVQGRLEDPPNDLWEKHETGLVTFSPDNPVAQVLANAGPWTIDKVPALDVGITARYTVADATPEEVSKHRKRLDTGLPAITAELEALEDIKVVVLPPGSVPTVNGKPFVDHKFVATALEDGRGGYRKKPHWAPVKADLKTIAERAAKKSQVKGDGILRGTQDAS